MHEAFDVTAIARLRTGPFLGEPVYLRPDDAPNSSTHAAGVNLEWAFGERASVGAGYWSIFDSDSIRRDGLDVFDVRGEIHPLERLPGLVFSAELVYEKNGRVNESWGGYAELGHAFDGAPGTPSVSYRFARFTGNRGDLRPIEAFDPLVYGLSDWGSWYLGEIFGECVGTNRNLNAHVLRLRVEPREGWTVNLLWPVFRLEERATELEARLFDPRFLEIRDKHLEHEVDLAVDWEMNDHLTWSAVVGALVPGDDLEQAARGDSVSTHVMLQASVFF